MQITALYIYPIKSLGGISLTESILEKRGLAYDRRWMLVDEEGLFISQREVPTLALLQPEIIGNRLMIYHRLNKLNPLAIPLDPVPSTAQIQVQVWDAVCKAQTVSREADDWFNEALGTSCRLVYMPDSSLRPVNPVYGQPGEMVGFADSCPLLIVGEASVADLNNRLDFPITINRFRPNITFSGGEPYEEESWKDFLLGEVAIRGMRACSRCQITTIDQETGKIGSEPLRTLSTYRRQGNKVLFGLHAGLLVENGRVSTPTIKVGAEIKVIKRVVAQEL